VLPDPSPQHIGISVCSSAEEVQKVEWCAVYSMPPSISSRVSDRTSFCPGASTKITTSITRKSPRYVSTTTEEVADLAAIHQQLMDIEQESAQARYFLKELGGIIAVMSGELRFFQCSRNNRSDFQAFDNFSVFQVGLDNFINIFLIDVGVPDFFRVDDDDWAFIATIKAAGIIDTDFSFAGQPEFLDTLLGVVAHFLGVMIVAAACAIGALVDTKENVMLIVTHAFTSVLFLSRSG